MDRGTQCRRRLCAAVLFTLAASPLIAQEAAPRRVQVSVDPRVELVSIIFRLAGNSEYNRAEASPYIEDVDRQFRPCREHPVVQLVSRLKQTRGLGYDAPMSLAVFIKDIDSFETLAPLDPWPTTVDKRWTEEDTREFLTQARDFAEVSNFREFYAGHQQLYAASVTRLEDLFSKEAHFDWFDSFFGARPQTTFRVVISQLNGPNNYGSRTLSEDAGDYYCVLGVWSVDEGGVPEFDASIMSVVIHEFCHSYVNPFVYGHLAELEAPCNKLFQRREERMRRMAYPHWETMAHESLVRACVTRYAYDTQGETAGDRQGQEEAGQGFSWVPELAELLGEYEDQRDIYPDLGAFFPEFVDFINTYAERPEENVDQSVLYLILVSVFLMIAIAMGAPLGWKLKTGVQWRWLWLGAGLWALGVALKTIAALLLNEPLLGALKESLPYAGYVAAGSVYIGLLTGIFEIVLVFAATLIWRQMARDGSRAAAVGIGAGSFEALLIGMATFVSVLVALSALPGTDSVRQLLMRSAGTTSLIWLVGPVERCIAICCHVASRTLVLYAATARRWSYFWYGFLLLSAVDTIAGVTVLTKAQEHVSSWWIEAALLPFAAVSVTALIWCLRHWPKESLASGGTGVASIEVVES